MICTDNTPEFLKHVDSYLTSTVATRYYHSTPDARTKWGTQMDTLAEFVPAHMGDEFVPVKQFTLYPKHDLRIRCTVERNPDSKLLGIARRDWFGDSAVWVDWVDTVNFYADMFDGLELFLADDQIEYLADVLNKLRSTAQRIAKT